MTILCRNNDFIIIFLTKMLYCFFIASKQYLNYFYIQNKRLKDFFFFYSKPRGYWISGVSSGKGTLQGQRIFEDLVPWERIGQCENWNFGKKLSLLAPFQMSVPSFCTVQVQCLELVHAVSIVEGVKVPPKKNMATPLHG